MEVEAEEIRGSQEEDKAQVMQQFTQVDEDVGQRRRSQEEEAAETQRSSEEEEPEGLQ